MSQSVLIPIEITPELIAGALELERTAAGVVVHRLPALARSQLDDPQLQMVEAQPSGVRVRARTRATVIELDVLPTRRDYAGFPPRPVGVYDLCIDGRLHHQQSAETGRIVRIDMATGVAETEEASPQILRFAGLPAREKLIELWLPHNESTELVALRADSGLDPVTSAGPRVWLHHGSSISQGSNAASPTGIWPVVAARQAGVDIVNLGFGGSAMLDPFTARAVRDTPADLISLKIGINLVNGDIMRRRAFGPAVNGFLDTIREGHPKTPLLVISPIYCPIHEKTPGPGQFDFAALREGRVQFVAEGDSSEVAKGKLTLEVIRGDLHSLVKRRAQDDQHLHYLDGLALYGAMDHAAAPLPDALHPDAETHRMIGNRFAALAFAQGAFSSTAP